MENKSKIDYYIEASNIARGYKQTVGEKNEYYITLRQLDMILGTKLEPYHHPDL